MFTGIITALGSIQSIQPNSAQDSCRLVIDIDHLASSAAIGDSIAINGVCLTVVEIENNAATFDVSHESLEKTCIGQWQEQQLVNLEAALRVGDKLGGHIVSGHVDGVGSLVSRLVDGDSEIFRFALPTDGSVKIVEKGSISIDGISLTCFNCQNGQFEIAVIPHTLAVTNLGPMQVGQTVHMEQDMIGRWVASLMPGS